MWKQKMGIFLDMGECEDTGISMVLIFVLILVIKVVFSQGFGICKNLNIENYVRGEFQREVYLQVGV